MYSTVRTFLGHRRCVSLLLGEAASATTVPALSPLNCRNTAGMMPVHAAVCQGNTAFVAALLAAGAGQPYVTARCVCTVCVRSSHGMFVLFG
jgi:ankyrin repeat protein